MTGSTMPAPAPAARRSRGGPRALYAGNARSVLS
ncbi:ABC transporter, partial [Clavibacter michiganensis subsp. insidiosus]